jgi:hypothetical protein
MAPGTIRNLVWKKVFIENVHYVKPSARKLLFVWSGVKQWLHGQSTISTTRESLINI